MELLELKEKKSRNVKESLQQQFELGSNVTDTLLNCINTPKLLLCLQKERRKKKLFKSKSIQHWRRFSDADLSLLKVPSSAGEAAAEYREMYFPPIIHAAY